MTPVATRTRTLLFAATAAAATLAIPTLAQARKSPLEGQPAVRHKYELRLQRFEVAPTFEATVGADYKHTLSGGIKAEYHLSDTLSFGGLVFFGASMDTGLTEQIRDSLPTTQSPADPTPSRQTFDNHLNTMPIHGGIHATFTPWFGKMALFGKTFLAFDMYVSGGFGFAVLKNEFGEDYCAPKPDPMDPAYSEQNPNVDPRNDCPYNSGFKPGLQFGAGMHVFLSKWVALDFSFRNYMFSDNPSGLDFNADGRVDSDDPRFMSHLFFGVGVSLFLPPKVKISR